jgi:hypothetical protein
LAQSHQGGKIEEINVTIAGAAVGDDAVLRFIELSPKTVSAGQEQVSTRA